MKQTTEDLLMETNRLLKQLLRAKGVVDEDIHYHNGLACNQKH
jgi:hypothetical protein